MAYRDSKWVCSQCGDFIYKQCVNVRCKDGQTNEVVFELTKEENEELKRIREGEDK